MRQSCSKTKRFSAAPKNLPSRKSAGALWNISVSRKGKPATTAFKRKRRPLKAAESKSSAFLSKQRYVHKPPLRRGLYFFTANAPAGSAGCCFEFLYKSGLFFNTDFLRKNKKTFGCFFVMVVPERLNQNLNQQ